MWKILYIDSSSYLHKNGKVALFKNKALAGNCVTYICWNLFPFSACLSIAETVSIKGGTIGFSSRLTELMSNGRKMRKNSSRRFKLDVKLGKKRKIKAHVKYRKMWPVAYPKGYYNVTSDPKEIGYCSTYIPFNMLKDSYLKSLSGPCRSERVRYFLKSHFALVKVEEI